MSISYLHLGSNLGNRQQYLTDAIENIKESLGDLIAKSPVYETEAWGNRDQNDFLNQALAIETKLAPLDLLSEIHVIEKKIGRKREIKWGPRVIDIDILFYDDLVIETLELELPHPFLTERKFVLEPLKDIAADLVHPTVNKTIIELFRINHDQTTVKLLSS